MADAALDVAGAALADGGPVDAVGITNQRASTIVWDRATGEPVGPGVGWQDLRTVGMCLVLAASRASGSLRTSRRPSSRSCSTWPTPSAPARPVLRHRRHVDRVDAVGRRSSTSPTSPTPASPGLVRGDGDGLGRPRARGAAHPDVACCPTDRRLDRRRRRGDRARRARRRSRASSATSRRRSIGQGCVRPGLAKITFGTGGMLDMCLGAERPAFERRGDGGTFPIVAWRRARARSRGASRRSCCRPAPTSSGCATTSA